MPTLHKTEIYGDWDVENIYPGYAYKDHGWNGWSVPFFALAEAEHIVMRQHQMFAEALERSPDYPIEQEWDLLFWDGDSILSVYQDGNETWIDEIEPNADGLYCIHGWSWCWQDVKIHGDPRKNYEIPVDTAATA